jgi:hypothetical protein
MMKRIALVLLSLMVAVPALAQRPGTVEGPIPTIKERTAGMQKLEGLFNLYWEEKAERMWLEIEKLDTEFLYVTDLASSFSGRNRGSWNGGQVIRFDRYSSRVFMTQLNYRYRAVTSDPVERRAVAEAYTDPVIFSFRVAAEETGRVLVDATDFFLRDAMNLGMGALDRNRSAFYWPRTKNFPKNTEVEVILTFTGAPSAAAMTGGRGGAAPTAAVEPGSRGGGGQGGTTVRLHHSFIELPDNQYKPRRYDPRSGVMGVQFTDYASPFSESSRREYSARFRIVKKNPNAAQSEPVKPVIYYIDPSTPEPIRSALVEGASWWNQAFEAAGFKNGFQAKVLPPDADPMDLRYNVMLWVHSPNRSWSSGASLTDPRTGEIITGRVFLGSDRIRQDFLIGSSLKALYPGNASNTKEVEEMALARIRQLSAHEIGHTLGFGHNYVSSTANRASVMDYPHPLIKIRDNGTLDFSDAYATGIGEWDKVFVKYAYTHFPDGTNEDPALDKILMDAQARGLYCLSESGDASAHPYSHDWDNGPDPLAELERVLKIRQIALKNFSEANIPIRTPLARLEEVLVPAYLFHRYQTQAAGKSIGGVDYRPAVRGDGQTPVKVVPADTQRRALKLLLTTLSPETLAIPRNIIAVIPPRAGVRGGEVFPRRTSSTFDPLAAAETAANIPLAVIFDSARAGRLLANRALDPDAPTLGEVIDTVFNATWKAEPPMDPYLADIHRVVDGAVLFHLMRLASDENAAGEARAMAALKLDQLKLFLAGKAIKDEAQEAHHKFAINQIVLYQADPSKFVFPVPAVAPPGPPIGMGESPLPWLVWDDQDEEK